MKIITLNVVISTYFTKNIIRNNKKIITNESFETLGSMLVIQDKNFSNEVICSHTLVGLWFTQMNSKILKNPL